MMMIIKVHYICITLHKGIEIIQSVQTITTANKSDCRGAKNYRNQTDLKGIDDGEMYNITGQINYSTIIIIIIR